MCLVISTGRFDRLIARVYLNLLQQPSFSLQTEADIVKLVAISASGSAIRIIKPHVLLPSQKLRHTCRAETAPQHAP